MRKRWVFFLYGVLVVVLFVSGSTAALYLHNRSGVPAYRLGGALGQLFYPQIAAAVLCSSFGASQPLCLRGYYTSRLSGPLVGDPALPCRNLSAPLARACSEIQGLRLAEYRVSRPLAVCGQMSDPLACARYVGRGVFREGGFVAGGSRSAKAVCGQGDGDYLAHCRVGASMEAVERYGEKILAAAEDFCRNYGEGLCYGGIVSALRSIRSKEQALNACARLSPRGAAWCVRGLRDF